MTGPSSDRERPVAPHEPTEGALTQLAHQLEERVKELDCLFGLSEIVERARG